jgi:hypothetical protein
VFKIELKEEQRKAIVDLLVGPPEANCPYTREEMELLADISTHAANEAIAAITRVSANCVAPAIAIAHTLAVLEAHIPAMRQAIMAVAQDETGSCDCIACQLQAALGSDAIDITDLGDGIQVIIMGEPAPGSKPH